MKQVITEWHEEIEYHYCGFCPYCKEQISEYRTSVWIEDLEEWLCLEDGEKGTYKAKCHLCGNKFKLILK